MTIASSGAPSTRSVARPVANLGNTCYMNAVLQALAHAPELCLAMDCEPHHLTCPIYAENAAKRRAASPSSSSDDGSNKEPRKTGTRKSRRSGGRRSPQEGEENGDQGFRFCALCEVEQHLAQVHDSTKKDDPVAPSDFVHGFIDQVAPWFKLGVQEDSHEFLRLLIDAMQKSCQQARPQDNPQDDSPTSEEQDDETAKDSEYPFSLFRGSVESNVTCESCKASSSTLDPIEDIGLEVNAAPTTSERLSRNTSPVPFSALHDVQAAFQRYAKVEELDAGYKCEKCGKVGRATKQSRLAAIPPILTLHLKRFRYGDSRTTAGTVTTTTGRRTGRSEVSQLMGNNAADFLTGKSGSAKIEGHIKFDVLFDLKPYLTEELQKKHSNMFCRLFAVIVHAGKNSHSGHYIAYVRSLAKNEWWKMDDGRVTLVSPDEVMRAEAYMLFYRVVQHPVAVQLEEKYKNRVAAVEDKVETKREAAAIEPDVSSVRRKRPPPAFENGEDWARAKTNIPPSLMGIFRKAQEMVADDIQLSPAYFKIISEEAAKEGAIIGSGPSSSVCGKLSEWTAEFVKLILNEAFYASEDDVVGGAEKFRRVLCDLFYKLAKHFEGESATWLSLEKKGKASDDGQRVAVVEPEDVDLL